MCTTSPNTEDCGVSVVQYSCSATNKMNKEMKKLKFWTFLKGCCGNIYTITNTPLTLTGSRVWRYGHYATFEAKVHVYVHYLLPIHFVPGGT